MIEDEFSKVALRNAIKYFKPHSENDCVGATVKVMEYSLTKKEVPKPYQTLLKEIRKDSPVSSWLPSYSQRDTTLLVTFLNQECDVFSDFLFCLFVHPTSFNRSTKARALISTSSHFSPTKNFWSWGASGQGRRSSTRCLPPARWPSSDLICPIFSNKWLYLNISRPEYYKYMIRAARTFYCR